MCSSSWRQGKTASPCLKLLTAPQPYETWAQRGPKRILQHPQACNFSKSIFAIFSLSLDLHLRHYLRQVGWNEEQLPSRVHCMIRYIVHEANKLLYFHCISLPYTQGHSLSCTKGTAGSFPRGKKRPGRDSGHLPLLVPRLSKRGAIPPLPPPKCLPWHVVGQVYFTYTQGQWTSEIKELHALEHCNIWTFSPYLIEDTTRLHYKNQLVTPINTL
jgi:hypothetical protein